MKIHAFIVSVNYADLLAITLPRLVSQVDRVTVISVPDDVFTRAVAEQAAAAFVKRDVDGKIELHLTEAFYRYGAAFNKAAALEEATAAAFATPDACDWCLLIDADVAVQNDLRQTVQRLAVRTDCLYGCPRYGARYAYQWQQCLDSDGRILWDRLPRVRDGELGGWFQLFCQKTVSRPWFDASWKHAGGYDSAFWGRWAPDKRCWLSAAVVHLGEDGQNWHGRRTEFWNGSGAALAGALNSEQIAAARAAYEAARAAGQKAMEAKA